MLFRDLLYMTVQIVLETLKDQVLYPIYYNKKPIFAAKHSLLGALGLAASKNIISFDTLNKLAVALSAPHTFKTPFGTFEADTLDAWRRFHPTYEQGFRDIITQRSAQHMKAGKDVVINAGANVGRWTIELANMGYNVLAFEPIPRIYDKLKKNIELSKLTHKVQTFNIALGEAEKEETMHVFRFHEGASYLDNVLQPYTLALAENMTVNVKPFDDIYTWIISEVENKIGTIVIDVEWYELFALQGMSKFLEQAGSLDLFIEISPKSIYKQQLLQFLEQHSFTGSQIDDKNNRYFSR